MLINTWGIELLRGLKYYMCKMKMSSIPQSGSPRRLYYVDWLRAIAIVFIFLYHNNRFYNAHDWHISNAQLSLGSAAFVDTLNIFIMPLFFFLSGAAIYYSLKSRTAGGFLRERVLRVMVPWVILGMFVIGPIQVYLERFTHGQFTGNFFQFYWPHYFEGLYAITPGGNFAFAGMHLWYLMLLFVYSLLFLPLFLPSRRTGFSILSRLGEKLARPWGLFMPILGLVVASLLKDLLGLGFTEQMGSWDVLSYMVFFLSGYMIFSSERFQEIVRRYAFATLTAALVLTAYQWLFWIALESRGYPDLRGFPAWALVLAIVGLGSRYLNFNNRRRETINEAVMPFYILHQTVILVIGFFVIPLALNIPTKLAIIVPSSFVGILAIYWLVKQTNATRFLFGMKLIKREETPHPPTRKV
jgi:glucans biosynthesis protein C